MMQPARNTPPRRVMDYSGQSSYSVLPRSEYDVLVSECREIVNDQWEYLTLERYAFPDIVTGFVTSVITRYSLGTQTRLPFSIQPLPLQYTDEQLAAYCQSLPPDGDGEVNRAVIIDWRGGKFWLTTGTGTSTDTEIFKSVVLCQKINSPVTLSIAEGLPDTVRIPYSLLDTLADTHPGQLYRDCIELLNRPSTLERGVTLKRTRLLSLLRSTNNRIFRVWFAVLLMGGDVSGRQVADKLEIDPTHAHDYLRTCVRRGIVERRGKSGRNVNNRPHTYLYTAITGDKL